MKRYLLIIPMLVALSGCSGVGVKMEPFEPVEVQVLVDAATATFLMQRSVTKESAAQAANYVRVVRGTFSTGQLDMASLREEIVDKVPEQWQPLANASWVLLLRRINLEQLIAEGQHEKARQYIDAALLGALGALDRRSK